MKISVIGAGYVGLVSGVCFSEFGFDVTCIDRDEEKIACLRGDQSPIYEPGLDGMLRWNKEAGRLHFTAQMGDAVASSDVVIIAVGTPPVDGNGAADTQFVRQAAREVAISLSGFTVVAIKSTVPVGVTREIDQLIREVNPAADFEIASNPEFLREGSAIADFMRPDRVVLGAESARAREVMQNLYKPLAHQDTPILITNFESAELIKYASNSFLAMKVTYINQIADLCERLGADIHDVAKGIGMDDRIGPRFLQPGPGIGGSCFPKDTQALTAMARDAGSPITIIDTVVAANSVRKISMADKIVAAMGGDVRGKRIGVLGVSFKPNTDDMREAASLDILPRLQAAGGQICAYDPAAMQDAAKLLPGVEWCENPYAAAENTDGLVILTEWNEFKALDLNRVADAMNIPLVIDLRSIYSLEEVEGTPLIYHSVGRATLVPPLSDTLKVL